MSPHIASGIQPPVRSGPSSRTLAVGVADESPADLDQPSDQSSDQSSDQRIRQRRERALAADELLDRARSAPEPECTRLRDQAIAEYLWLADAIARRYSGRGEESDDLIQIARAGLVEAANRYDNRHGSFPAFAAPTIAGVLKRHFRDHGWLVRPPRPTQETVTQINREWPLLTQKLGREPDDRALASQIGQSPDAVRQARLASGGYAASSLDAAANAGGALLADPCLDQDRVEDRLLLTKTWRQLTRTERRLLTMRFFEDRSQSDIAAEIGTSQMQVSRMLSRTFRKMRRLIAGADGGGVNSIVGSGPLVVDGRR